MSIIAFPLNEKETGEAMRVPKGTDEGNSYLLSDKRLISVTQRQDWGGKRRRAHSIIRTALGSDSNNRTP